MRKLTKGLVALVISTTILGSCKKDNEPSLIPSKATNHLAAVSNYCHLVIEDLGSLVQYCQKTKESENKDICNQIEQSYNKRLQDCEKKLRIYD